MCHDGGRTRPLSRPGTPRRYTPVGTPAARSADVHQHALRKARAADGEGIAASTRHG